MSKYFYLFGVIVSYITFQLGWSHYLDNGFDAFNLGFMALTPVITIFLTLFYLRSADKKDEDFFLDK